MQQNVGSSERVVRVVIGLAMIAAGVYYQSWWGAIGAIPVATGLLGWCPPYSLLGINTCSVKKT